MTPRIWVLTDDRAGNVAQCLGVAEKLGLPFEVKQIRYNRLGNLPNFMLGATFATIDTEQSSSIEEPWPDLVIAAGRRTAPIALAIKQKHPQTFLAQLMLPGFKGEFFNLIAVPEHDRVPPAPNLIRTLGAPHRLTPSLLQEQAAIWREKFASLTAPRIALLVGGASKHGDYSLDDFRALATAASDFANERKGSLLVTTSRRSGPGAEAIFRNSLAAPHAFYGWQSGQENPYLAYLGLADILIATGDSISMLSEACFTGKPLYVFNTEAHLSPKLRHFHESLYARRLARPLGATENESWYAGKPVDAAAEIAEAIRHKLDFSFQEV